MSTVQQRFAEVGARSRVARTAVRALVTVVLFGWVGVVPAAGWPTVSAQAEPIRVGILHSLTGSVAIAERPINETTLLAIEEINASGGLLGRRVEPIIVDGRSDWPTFAAEAERLIGEEHVEAVFGCYTSASRRTVVPIFERHHNALFYPTFYEGVESSPNVVYTGATPNQYIIPAVKWFMENRGKRIFLVGSDYIWPRAANAVIKAQAEYLGGTVVGEKYLPLGSSETAPILQAIKETQPEVIVSTVVGDTNIPFFRDLRAAGITPKTIPTLSLALGETELQSLETATMAGDYVAQTYFQSIDTADNHRFVAEVKRRYGPDTVVSDQMEAAYASVHLWAQAVRSAGSADPQRVLRAIRGMGMNAPQGRVYVDEENLHTWKTPRIGRIRADGQVDIIWASEALVHPMPYSIFRTKQAWEDMVSELFRMWGGDWSAPAG
ncbi:urea ABC transporter substrate-binding protein [Nocardia sp. NBC_01499]|uniref:urea ABC transporter substrate-binding protein n=1 Tax=Nocardia sp. NBC_01499 TaxID=2903597 RepID=UPI003865A41F